MWQSGFIFFRKGGKLEMQENVNVFVKERK